MYNWIEPQTVDWHIAEFPDDILEDVEASNINQNGLQFINTQGKTFVEAKRVSGDPVIIVDPALQAAIGLEGPITESSVIGLKRLEVTDPVYTLQGIEDIPDLKELKLNNSFITNLSPAVHLEKLILHNNQLTPLFDTCPASLNILNIEGTVLDQSALDAVALLPNAVIHDYAEDLIVFADSALESALLEYLEKLSDAVYEEDLVKLRKLHLPAKGISDIDPLEFCLALTDLNIALNFIDDLTPILALPVTTLNIAINPIPGDSELPETVVTLEAEGIELTPETVSSIENLRIGGPLIFVPIEPEGTDYNIIGATYIGQVIAFFDQTLDPFTLYIYRGNPEDVPAEENLLYTVRTMSGLNIESFENTTPITVNAHSHGLDQSYLLSLSTDVDQLNTFWAITVIDNDTFTLNNSQELLALPTTWACFAGQYLTPQDLITLGQIDTFIQTTSTRKNIFRITLPDSIGLVSSAMPEFVVSASIETGSIVITEDIVSYPAYSYSASISIECTVQDATEVGIYRISDNSLVYDLGDLTQGEVIGQREGVDIYAYRLTADIPMAVCTLMTEEPCFVMIKSTTYPDGDIAGTQEAPECFPYSPVTNAIIKFLTAATVEGFEVADLFVTVPENKTIKIGPFSSIFHHEVEGYPNVVRMELFVNRTPQSGDISVKVVTL